MRPGLEMDENAMEIVAIGGSFLDKVDVVDFATGITFSETRLAEDSANAAILDIDEYPGDAEGRLVGLELDFFFEPKYGGSFFSKKRLFRPRPGTPLESS